MFVQEHMCCSFWIPAHCHILLSGWLWVTPHGAVHPNWPSSIRGVWHLAFLWSCNCSFGVSLGFGCTLQDESNRLLSTFIEKLKLYSYWARNHTHAGLHIRLREIWIIHFEDAGHSAHFMHIQIIEGQIYKVSTDIWQNSNPSRTKTIFPIAYLCCRKMRFKTNKTICN